MRLLLKTITALILLIGFATQSYGQDPITTPLALGKIDPYQMEVTYDKTSHLIFPSTIRYVDLGSENLIAGKAEDAENVLRVKASTANFESQTNFSVITEDGQFYSFDVFYSPHPTTLNYDMLKMQKTTHRENSSAVLFEELGGASPTLTGLVLQTIYNKNKKKIHHIGSKSFGMTFLLKAIYIHNGKYYFHTELDNHTNVPFEIDFINFKITDKKAAKRTVVQQRALKPIRIYKLLETIKGKSDDRNVFMLDQFTIADDKVLLIEIFERDGGRNQILQVENSDLIEAQLIEDLHLKFD